MVVVVNPIKSLYKLYNPICLKFKMIEKMAVQGLKFAWRSQLEAKGVEGKKYGASLKGSQDTEKM